MKIFAVIQFCFFIPMVSYSQLTRDEKDSLLFSKDYLALNFGVTLGNDASERISGIERVLTPVFLGFNFIGFSYTINVHKNFGIQMGINAGLQSFSYKYNIQGTNAAGDYDRKSSYRIGLEFPCHLTGRFRVNDKLFIFGATGIDLRTYPRSSAFFHAEFYSNNTNREFSIDVEYGAVNINLSYPVEAGIFVLMQNNNLVKISLLTSIGGNRTVKGDYFYYENGAEVSSGEYFSYGTYYGLGLSYIFTRIHN